MPPSHPVPSTNSNELASKSSPCHPWRRSACSPYLETPAYKFSPCTLTAKFPFKSPPMQWEPVAMQHQLSSAQKSCSPAGCMPISISPRHTLPSVNPPLSPSFPLLPRSSCGQSNPAGCQTQLLFFLLLLLLWKIILIPSSTHLYYLVW